jgi:hypothetical protein
MRQAFGFIRFYLPVATCKLKVTQDRPLCQSAVII